MYRLTVALLLSWLIIFSVGCSTEADPEPPLEELTAESAITSNKAETELLALAQKYYENQLYAIARDSFQALIDTYPLTRWREFAEIKIADSLFESGEYPEAAQSYKAFVDAHPASDSNSYMLTQLGRCYKLQYRGVGRDIGYLQEGMKYFSELEKKFPQHAYGALAREYRFELEKLMAEHEMSIISYYKKQGETAAYEARLAAYNETWKPILEQLAAAERQEELEPEVIQERSLVVVENTLVQSDQELSSPESSEIDLSLVRARAREILFEAGDEINPDGKSKNRITEVTCKAGDSAYRISIFLSEQIPQEEFESRYFPNESGELSIAIPNSSARARAISCFGDKDLRLSKTGNLRVHPASGEATVISLANPPRALVVVSN